MQASQTGVIVTLIIATLVILGGIAYVATTQPTAEEIAANIDTPTIVIPTAAEIASQVKVNTADDNTDVLAGVYPAKVSVLKSNCINNLQNEFSTTDVKDKIEVVIEASEGQQITGLTILDWNYENNFNFKVINLGLDNFADRSAQITSILQVKYKLVNGNQDEFKQLVKATALCSNWDNEAGHTHEFDDLNVSFVLA